MLALPQLKALLKEHNLYRCYINKNDDIATTPTSFNPKMRQRKQKQ